MGVEFGEIQKFSKLAEQAGNLSNKYTVNYIFLQQSRHNYTFSCNIENTHCCIFSTAESTAVLMQSVICKPYIFTKQPKIARQSTPPGRDLWWKVAVLGSTDGE